MKHPISLALLLLSTHLSAQNKPMFDTVTLEPGTKLIGRYPQYDQNKTYSSLNFCITDTAAIRKAFSLLTIGNEVPNAFETRGFDIAIIKGGYETNHWWINPTGKSAGFNGHTYKFDIEKLKQLSKQYPFDYRFEKLVFKTMEEYEAYLAKQKSDSSFLFSYSPSFRFEGSFDMQFPRNSRFSSPKAITEYLEPIITNIVSKKEYSAIYILNEKNRRDQQQFTMTIMGSKKLYDNLQVDNIDKQEWQPSVETGWFFFRTK